MLNKVMTGRERLISEAMIMMKKLDDILYRVEKPSRYIGGEINSAMKAVTEDMVRFGFAFPDVYEVGMSHLGMHILYGLLNSKADVFCERVFAPWTDLEAEMRQEGVELFTLETKSPVRDLDILGFTLQYELSYTNIINMLDLGGIAVRSKDRKDSDPIVIAGGPCAYNPEPIAAIIDAFVLGEGEEVVLELVDKIRECKKAGFGRLETLRKLARIDSVYVPSLYEVHYNEDGTIKSFMPMEEGVPQTITKRIIKDLDSVYYPDRFIVPFMDTVHDRAMVEIFRGCTAGCRFCQAGMIYRPVREKNVDVIQEAAMELIRTTGFEELSLASLSTMDYSRIEDLIKGLVEDHEANKVGLSLPSLRLNSFSVSVVEQIQKVRKTGLTFAPEAGTQRMRDVINKGVTEEDLMGTMDRIFNLGWSKVKLYFMIGLPTETEEDLQGIAQLGEQVSGLYYGMPKELRSGRLTVTLSASCFVPKPFTPFQWMAQDKLETFESKQRIVKGAIKDRAVKFNYHDAHTSFLEGVVARGDRRVADVLIQAWENGCKFDGWQEHFNYDNWMSAFEKTGVDPYFYASRERSYDEVLPWDFIDIGVSKKFLIQENEKATKGEVTRDCREGCTGCGINIGLFEGGC